MKLFLIIFLALTCFLKARPILYEGFDVGLSSISLGAASVRSGQSSEGWLSDWHLKQGKARFLEEDLFLSGLSSSQGLVSSKGKTIVMRQSGETFTGDVYGSFRVRAEKLKDNSMMGMLVGLPNADPVNPKTAFISFLAARWGSDLGGLVLGGKPVKVESGVGLRTGESALVLWKIENLPEPGQKSDQLIQMWILNAEQVAHFAMGGMEEKALRKAKLGIEPEAVMQYLRVPTRGSRLTLAKGLVFSCFSVDVPKADFDEIRLSRESLADAAGIVETMSAATLSFNKGARDPSPNILFVTMDDMNWDSMGAYGCKLPGITANMDRLVAEGMHFQYAYNQTSSCVPSRNTYQTGRYPHTTGVLSFYNVDARFATLPEILRANGYLTGCVNKPRDTSLTEDYQKYWDFHVIMKDADKRGAPTYQRHFNAFLDRVEQAGKPFYGVVNIADPHKPFYDDPEGIKEGFNKFAPSTRYETDEVKVPGFLPEHPDIREAMRNYYNSVKRGDDCVGVILDTLRQRGFEENTLVILISDHGMPLPYAKSSLYADGLRTPWVARWPGKIKANQTDTEHLVSAIDFMPTVLDIAGIVHPEGLQGRSVWPAMLGKPVNGLDRVYAEFNDNAGGLSFPMRAIHTKKYAYIFNAWGTGNHSFVSAATWHRSEAVMKRMANADPDFAQRYAFLLHRCVEELYDLEKDPFALNNRIGDRGFASIANEMRVDMELWMRETNDYVLEAFLVRDNLAALDAFMKKADAAALERAETLQWKRYRNRAGGTGKNSALYTAQ